jgi:hypothetical protein
MIEITISNSRISYFCKCLNCGSHTSMTYATMCCNWCYKPIPNFFRLLHNATENRCEYHFKKEINGVKVTSNKITK